jgi:hypothetical protein
MLLRKWHIEPSDLRQLFAIDNHFGLLILYMGHLAMADVTLFYCVMGRGSP